jgi:UDP-3-O-[3-hydroxymyristoyl] glucosamine N-acyltransferase
VNITLQQVAALTQGTLIIGEPDSTITGFSSIKEAESGDVTFLGNARYANDLKKSKASAVIALPDFTTAPAGMAVIQSENPTLAFSAIIKEFGPQKKVFAPGVHATASVSADAKFDPTKIYVGPNAVIEDGAEIGEGTLIYGGAYVGPDAKIGKDCVIHANAIIKDNCLLGDRVIIHSGAVIGADGFGYQFSGGKQLKIEQVGRVQIDDDVEIGSCSTIDRARFGRTWIGEGTKIDNLVQIAHNVIIGKHCVIVALVAIAGSARIGNYVTIAGQVGVGGHLNVCDQVVLLARSGVTKDISEPGYYMGFPTKPLMEGRRLVAHQAKQPELFQRIKTLEKRLAELEAKAEK